MDYKLFKFRKAIENIFKKLIKILFYVPAWLYKNNEKFYKFIEESRNKSYKKSKKKYLAKRVFRCLEKNQNCTVFVGIDDEDGYFDLYNISFDLLFSDEKWIKRNKLKVEETTFSEYVELHYPDRIMWSVRDWNKDKKVYIVSR